MSETITSLIEKLEAASEGSRELDCEIWTATGGWDHVGRPPAFSTSLDAALALAERVLPGYAMNACKDLGPTEGPDFRWSSVVAPRSLEGPVGRKGWHFGVADTPAVALCIAILKSLRAQSEARV